MKQPNIEEIFNPNLIKTPEQIECIRETGRIVAITLAAMEDAMQNGEWNTLRLDELAESILTKNGAKSAFKGYTPPYQKDAYPYNTCISVNNEVVNGVPNELKLLKEGSLVTLDLSAEINGWFADSAITVPVGDIDWIAYNLNVTTRVAMKEGIRAVKPGNTLGDVGNAISTYAEKHNYGVPRNLTGHFIGQFANEPPEVPNFGDKGSGLVLKPGMVFCIEPILCIGSGMVKIAEQSFFTFVTVDECPSAHFEHTVVVTDDGVDVLTSR